MEKLEFSMQDLGRFAAFMDGHPGHPLDAIKDWIHQYSDDANSAEIAYGKIQEGYEEEL